MSSLSSSFADGQVILCTGANRGLGFAIIQAIARRLDSATYILACRNVTSGHLALKLLRNFGIGVAAEVLELDITDDEDILSAVEHVQKMYGRLDGELLSRRPYPFPAPFINSHEQLFPTINEEPNKPAVSPDQQRRHSRNTLTSPFHPQL